MSSNVLKSAASAKTGKIFLNKRNEIGLSHEEITETLGCLLYTSPSPRDLP